MKRHLITVLALTTVAAMASAKGSVKGSVTNKETGEPLEFANVQLLDSSGKALALGTQTDLDGNFVIVDVPDGKYIIKVSNLGSVAQEREITVSNGELAIGTISLAEDSKMLKEVVVTGVASQMRFELDRKVFSVDANIASSGASASELLESIPSVEVDQDGEVSLRGNSSVTVWINGKESGLTADNRAQILEQIPAETIDRIEVITNPSAKYSPEGTAGIINIVLKKDRRGGYFGSAELGANTQGGGNANFNINYNTSKWDTYASIGFRMRHNTGGSFSRRDYSNGDFLNSDASSRNHGNNIFARIGATYHLTPNDDISANGFAMFGHRWGHSDTRYLSNVPGQWTSNHNYSRSSSDMRGAHGELGYTHRFTDTHYIDFTAGFNHWGGPMWNLYRQEQEYDYDPSLDQTVVQTQNNDIKSNSVEVKLDYTNNLTSWLKLEAGFNGNYSHENSPVTTYEGPSEDNMTLDADLYNRFIYNNNISALYATLGGKYRNFSFSAGLRGEAWQIRARSLAYGQTEAQVDPYKRNSFALFPSAFLSWSLPHGNELQINYTRRIRRPWGGQLNPFRNISDPTNIHFGNEELQPEFSNAFELNYIKSFTNHILSFSGYLRTTSDAMSHISYIIDDIMYSTDANAGSRTDIGAEIVMKNGLFRNVLNLTTTANLFNNHISSWSLDFDHDGLTVPVSGKSQNTFAWNISCMANVRLPWDISFQATGRYNSRQLTAQGSREAGWNVDAGLRKSVGNWSFSINCRDIFDSRKMHSYTNGIVADGVTYSQENKRWRGGRRLQFTVKYSFGNMKAKRDRNAQSEPMDQSGYGDMGD